MKTLSIPALLLALALSGNAGATIIVNGDLSDWGIDKKTWKPTGTEIHYTAEDQSGGTGSWLSPGWGGQAYDAEAMYATFDDGKLYVALVTGHNPLTNNDPRNNKYAAGDFAIDFGQDGRYELGINVRAGGDKFGVEGGVYSHPTWAYGLWDVNGKEIKNSKLEPDKSHPTSLLNGTNIGTALLSYTTNGVKNYGGWKGDLHYFYEMSVDLDLLAAAGWDGSKFNIHWTQNCANDSILVDPGQNVPEPGSLALVGVGMIGLLGGGVRRLQKRG